MPKHEIDYSNTIIYKITCKDTNISDLYVGHTTNFVQRKHAHKQSCINEKSLNYKCKLYEVIRNNGGWVNWKMEIINFFNCKNHYEARKKEQEYFLSLNATLNSIEPYAIPKPKETVIKNIVLKEVFNCKECNKYFNNKDLLEIHNKTNKHKRRLDIMTTKKSKEISKKFLCENCDYSTCKNSEFKKHLLTNKHINTTKYNTLGILLEKEYICHCGKEYNHRASLFNHKKNCSLLDESSPQISEANITDSSKNIIELLINENKEFKIENKEFKNMIMELVKTNNDLQKQMVDVCKKIQPNNIVINKVKKI